MANENEKQYKYNRWWTGHIPATREKGPGTFILDTIVVPVRRKQSDDARN